MRMAARRRASPERIGFCFERGSCLRGDYFLMRVTFPAGSTSKVGSVALSRMLSAAGFRDVDFFGVDLAAAFGDAFPAVTPGMSGSAVT